jgi:hypothetical protein
MTLNNKIMKFTKSNPRKQIFQNGTKKQLFVADCVTRAIVHATSKTYKEVFQEITTYALHHPSCLPIHFEEVYGDYLLQLGFTKHKPKKNSKGKTYCVNKFPIEEGKKYIILTRSHLTAIVDGEHLDSWDCGSYRANSYYKID